jgi:hypothetical protein
MKFEFTEQETKKITKWIATLPNGPGTVSIWFKFKQTGVGLVRIVEVERQGKIEQLDLSDYENW